jgi:hypothetical protein
LTSFFIEPKENIFDFFRGAKRSFTSRFSPFSWLTTESHLLAKTGHTAESGSLGPAQYGSLPGPDGSASALSWGGLSDSHGRRDRLVNSRRTRHRSQPPNLSDSLSDGWVHAAGGHMRVRSTGVRTLHTAQPPRCRCFQSTTTALSQPTPDPFVPAIRIIARNGYLRAFLRPSRRGDTEGQE